MNTRMIEVSVRGQEISCYVPHPYPRTNTVQYLHVHFEVDEIWDPLKKIAVFRRSGTATVAVPLDETMMCEMPPQMMAVPGYSGPVTVHIGLIGVGENGGRLTTGEVPVTVNPSCYTVGKTPHPPTPDVYEELLRLIREAAENDAEEIRAALDEYFAENPLDVSGKLDKNQGAENAGKVLGIGEDGMVVPMDAPTGGESGIVEETDPTVSDWAKQPEKPAYTADEVGAIAQDQLEDAVNQALSEAKASGEFDGADGEPGPQGPRGEKGEPGVYIGSGDMPEGYNAQIDPNGDAFTVDDLIPDDIVTSVNGQTGDVQTRLMVTITANEDGTYTSSHTSQEIYAASQAGAVVEASNVNGARYSLYLCSEQFVQFLVMSVSGGSGNRSLNTRTFVINGDKVIKANSETPIPEAPANMVGATETAAGTAGLVPAPAAGDNGKFLRGDGTWGEIAIPEGGVDDGGGWELIDDVTIEEAVQSITFSGFSYQELKILAWNPAGTGAGAYVLPKINGYEIQGTVGGFIASGQFFSEGEKDGFIQVFAYGRTAEVVFNHQSFRASWRDGEYDKITSFTWGSFGKPENDQAIRVGGRYIVYGRN